MTEPTRPEEGPIADLRELLRAAANVANIMMPRKELRELLRTIDTLQRERDEARTEVERLWAEATRYFEALDCYGIHSAICATHYGSGCSCGLDAALATPEAPHA